MALTAKRKAELAKMNLPSDVEIRTRLNRFLLRSGLTRNEFADSLDYSYSSIRLFLSGNYDNHHPTEGNTLAMRAAVKEFLDLNETQREYEVSGRHYPTSAFNEIRRCAYNALRKGSAYIIDGPPGTEKTESLRRVQAEINQAKDGQAIYVYARVNHSAQTFLMECCVSAGIPNRGTIDQLLRKLAHFLSAERVVLFIDEAQHLDKAGLEVLRQLVDLPPYFGVILAGSHDLTQRLSHWQMEQWRSRVRKVLNLVGPTDQEAMDILRAEIPDMTDAECMTTIKSCQATAERLQSKGGKFLKERFTYTSARDLFGAIEQVHELINQSQEKGAA